ncbi:MAG TPA: two-component regulator propeller domain-containing protein [Saprospiraceae bacterium]|nr:two-component regulator propeller domain-containing protein [Saprospiraceae bacterium]
MKYFICIAGKSDLFLLSARTTLKYVSTFFIFVPLAISVLLFSCTCQAQHAQIAFEHYTTEQGLSAPVTHIVQDKSGFLWFGSTDGLNRFDGKNFIVYRNIPGDTTTLPNNIINSLHVDNRGRVWVATNGGLSYYDYADDQFHPITYDVTLEKLDQHRAHAVCGGQDSSIWFATKTILHQWKDAYPIISIQLPPVEDLTIKYLYVDSENRIYAGTNAGLYVYIQENGKFLHGSITSSFSVQKNLMVTVHPIIPYQHDTLMIGSWYAGLQKVFIAGDSIIHRPYSDMIETDPRRHIVSGIAPGTGSQWWIGTFGNGISWFDVHTNQFIDHFHHDPANSQSLGGDYVNDIFTDDADIVWIGTTEGLDKFDPLTQQFKSISIPVPPNQFAVYRLANTIVEDMHDPDFLWLCVSGVGLFHYHTSTQDFDLYQLDSDSAELANNLYSFYYDQQGRAWVGARSGVFLFDTQNRKFKAPPFKDNQNVYGVHDILQDQHGHFWFATNFNGISKYDEKEGTLVAYTQNANDPLSIPDNKIFCTLQASDGKIWVGTQNRGLFSLDPETHAFAFFEHDKSEPNSIPDNGVFDLYEDTHQHLWIATENGFADMDLSTYRITTYTTIDGLCNNTVLSITPDHRDHLWLATNNGLSYFDPSTRKFRNFYTNDGLPANRIDGEVFFSSDSTLYFGTTGMLSFCKPEDMKLNTRIPPVVITDFSILGKKVPVMRNAEGLEPIHLSYKENMITFSFAALNFSNAFLNQYAYKLDGFDPAWIYCGNEQSATYTNLNGGMYTFHVKGANNDGTWNEEGTSVVLYVYPPFWKTWWFFTFCIVSLAGILYALYRLRINQLMRLQHIRTRIARDLHDDIGSTLSSINMISSMADRRKETGKKSAELFATISSASSQALELMQDIVWSINPKNDKIEMILIRMRQYASEILEAAEISFHIETDEESRHALLPLEIRKDFYLIFKEAVNNIAKYSNAQNAIIRMKLDRHVLYLTIKDNGKGFDPHRVVHGNGLKNMKARASQLHGELTITSSPNEGTTIQLHIPLTP